MNQTERRVRGIRGSILESVPPDILLAEPGATNLIPVGLSVLSVGLSITTVLAADGPASLSNPDGLAHSTTLSVGNSLIEEALALTDIIGLRVLVVRVGVHAEPVKVGDDIAVGAIDKSSPGIDVTNRSLAQAGAVDGGSDLLDVADEGIRVQAGVLASLDADRRVSVEILRSNRDTNNEVPITLVAVLLDGSLESHDLVAESKVTSRCPNTKEESGLGLDSSGDGLDGEGRSVTLLWDGQQCPRDSHALLVATYNSGVETGRVESTIGTRECLGGVELIFVILLLLNGTVCEGCAIVETLEGSAGLANSSRSCENLARRRHGEI